MNKPAPPQVGDVLDWLREEGKRRSEAVPGFDAEKTLRKMHAASGPPDADGGSEHSPRGRILRLILELGPSTAATLGGRIGATPVAIRRHLDNLIAEGMVETRTARSYGNRGRGRPVRLFSITDTGRSICEYVYNELQSSADPGGTRAVADLVAHLRPHDNAVLRVGSLLVVKADGVVSAYQLTTDQQMSLEDTPQLFREPQEIARTLGLAPIAQDDRLKSQK